MRAAAAAAIAVAALTTSGCVGGPATPPAEALQTPRTVIAEAAAIGGVWIELRSQAENRSPVGHAPSVAWVPVARLADDGAHVRPGDELVRFADDVLRDWNDRDSFGLASDEQNRRLNLLRADGDIAALQTRIGLLRAQRAVIAAQLAASSEIDADQVRIAELQLDSARTALTAATRRRERLERIAAAGGAVTVADLATARGDEIKARAAVPGPQAALELARLPASSATVREMQLAIADLDAQIGETSLDGLQADLRTAQERRHRRELDRGYERRRREIALRTELLKDPVIRSRSDGMVQYREDGLEVGGKLPGLVSCVFVLAPGGMAVRLQVPERLRALVVPGARVALVARGAGGEALSGTVTSLAVAPEDARDGSSAFPALVGLDRVPAELRPGMRVDARLLVALPGSPAVIPSFCVSGGDKPTATLADGVRRTLEGWSYAGRFVALAGLAPGELVRVPDQAPVPGRLRISALVEPEQATPVVLRSWGWEPNELRAEGDVVHAGEVIARMSKTEYWHPVDQMRSDADLAMAKARIDLTVAQLDAADNRAGARSAWIRAVQACERTRIEAYVLRASWDPVAEAAAAAAVASAGVELERARRDLAATRAEQAAGSASLVQLRAAEVALSRAEVGLDRARLDAVAQELGHDWLDQHAKDDAVRTAQEDESAKRTLRLLAGEDYRAKLAAASAAFEGTARWVESQLRSIADEVVVAPADGTLVYVRSNDGRPRIGRQLETMEPFRIATGTRRRASFDLPARLFGRFKAGDRIRLHGDGQGDAAEGTVLKVAASFMPPRDLADEIALGRTIGQEDSVFQVTVVFDPPGGDAARLPPGSSVYAEF